MTTHAEGRPNAPAEIEALKPLREKLHEIQRAIPTLIAEHKKEKDASRKAELSSASSSLRGTLDDLIEKALALPETEEEDTAHFRAEAAAASNMLWQEFMRPQTA